MIYGAVLVTGPPDGAGETTSVRPELVGYFSGLQIHRDAVRDWDTKSVEWQVMDWPDDFGLER